MTGGQLKDELVRIAEAAPDVHVPDGLFARGRRATWRARALIGAAAVACLVLVGTVAAPLLRDEERRFADRDEPGGVPDVIYAPSDGTQPDLPVAPLDKIGPIAAAYVADDIDRQLVVVTADGSYLLIEVDDLVEPMVALLSPKLSPDGRRLAYSSDSDRGRRIGIIDLVTGRTTYVALGPALGVALRSMQWSPDSRWLGWSGQAVGSRTANSASYREQIIGGLIGPAGTSRRLPHREDGWDGLGVCDDGSVITWVWPSYTVTADGHTDRERSWRRIVDDHGDCSAPAAVLDAAQLDPEARLLGWLASDDGAREPTAVVLTPELDDDGSYGAASLQLASPGEEPTDVGSVVSVATDDLTVATGLMSEEHPTVRAGESPWAPSWWEEHRSDLFILAVLIAAPCLFVLFVRRRLRRWRHAER